MVYEPAFRFWYFCALLLNLNPATYAAKIGIEDQGTRFGVFNFFVCTNIGAKRDSNPVNV
jgi:hypothetical protein